MLEVESGLSSGKAGQTQDDCTDWELIQLILDRDESGLLSVFDLYGPRVLGLCKAIIPDALEAEGVMLEVILELWERPSAYNIERGSLQTYLLLKARCRSIDRRRSHKSRAAKIEEVTTQSNFVHRVDMETGETMSIQLETKKMVDEALDELPEQQKRSLRLAFFSGLSHQEVAAKLELPLGTVKSHIRKGLLKLKSMLAAEEEAGDTL